MIRGLDYWYDGTIRRYLEQIVRAFSGFSYMSGRRDGEEPQLRMVPCRMANADRMVANIMKNASENTVLAVPMIVVYQTGLSGTPQRIQNLNHVDSRQVAERAIDPVTGQYTAEQGRLYTVERLMPRPFEMSVNVDIWTSNLDQKHQLMEQILTVFYPDIAIQNSENPLDWGALTLLRLEDINWSSRSIPQGTDTDIDVATLSFRLPLWLSPPAKVTQQTRIETIIANIRDGDDIENPDNNPLVARSITTPGNHAVSVENGVVTLLGADGGETNLGGQVYDWASLIAQYGTLRPTISQIRLKTNPDLDDWDHDLVGTIQMDANHPNKLFWQIDPDTLPGNTLSPVEAVINPLSSWPGEGLPLPASGTRYLVVSDLGGPSQAWGTLQAKANDIIQYANGQWSVAFHPTQGETTPQYLVNLYTGRQLRWNGWDWVLTIDGTYAPGYWRISL